MRIFVTGLPPDAVESDLSIAMIEAGLSVKSVEVARDRVTDQCRGFGFVEVSEEDALARLAHARGLKFEQAREEER